MSENTHVVTAEESLLVSIYNKAVNAGIDADVDLERKMIVFFGSPEDILKFMNSFRVERNGYMTFPVTFRILDSSFKDAADPFAELDLLNI